MRLEEPAWWYGEGSDARARLLAPLAQVYGLIAQSRFRRRRPYRSRLPVICVGNFTAGGTGKTPLAIAVARHLKARGAAPVFLTRGYGGTERGPVWVEEAPDAARRFGDEALLLYRVAPTLVARDRAAGVRAIEESGRGAGAVVMDDGLQNPQVAKDLSIAVVDGRRGLGNGEVIPAGPLRAPIDFQLGLVDAIVVREPQGGKEARGIHAILRRRFPGPVLAARVTAQGDVSWVDGTPLVAFAGIADPERFFRLVARLGGRLLARVPFPDHHPFSHADAARLLALAEQHGARLVTTEKDWVRLDGDDAVLGRLREEARPVAIAMGFDERDLGRLAALIEGALRKGESPGA